MVAAGPPLQPPPPRSPRRWSSLLGAGSGGGGGSGEARVHHGSKGLAARRGDKSHREPAARALRSPPSTPAHDHRLFPLLPGTRSLSGCRRPPRELLQIRHLVTRLSQPFSSSSSRVARAALAGATAADELSTQHLYAEHTAGEPNLVLSRGGRTEGAGPGGTSCSFGPPPGRGDIARFSAFSSGRWLDPWRC